MWSYRRKLGRDNDPAYKKSTWSLTKPEADTLDDLRAHSLSLLIFTDIYIPINMYRKNNPKTGHNGENNRSAV